MPARITILLPDAATSTHILPSRAKAFQIGRDADCDVVIDHPTISRQHARLSCEADGWRLADSGSKNGSFVGETAIQSELLDKRSWLRFGDIFAQFETLTDQQADELGQNRTRRMAMTQQLSLDIKGGSDFADSMHDALRSILDLGQFQRGFIILCEKRSERMAVVAEMGGEAHMRLTGQEFRGTLSALQRCIDKRDTVIYNDIDAHHWLSQRASVVSEGIRALAVVPLLDDEELIGLIYCDRTTSLKPLSELDVSLLESFAQQASISIAVLLMQQTLDELSEQFHPDNSTTQPAFLDELHL